MKKILLSIILSIFAYGACFANEVTEDYFDIATNYCVEGNYREAANYLDKILLIEPNNQGVKNLRDGLRQIIQGKGRSFVISTSPAVRQSMEAKKIGNKQGELSALSSGNDYWAYYYLGEYYKENKDYNNALNYYIKSINAKNSFIQCYLEIAICYYELRNYNQAITYLNQYLKINTQDDFAYALRARCNANLGNNEAALTDILTAQALENDIDYKFLEGKILYNLRKYSQAKEKLESLSNEIQTAELYKYLGLSYAELGNNAEALLNLEKSIILSDDDKVVNAKYNELKMGIAHE